MRCLKMVNLRGNGLGEECAEEVEALLAMKRITRVDLSRNAMGKTCLQLIGKNFSHLEWVEYALRYAVSAETPSSSTESACKPSSTPSEPTAKSFTCRWTGRMRRC